MTEETARILDGWETRAFGSRSFDVAMEMTLLTQRIIVKTMFGADVGAEGESIIRAFETALAGIETRFLMPAVDNTAAPACGPPLREGPPGDR